MLCILTSPLTYQKLQAEIDTASLSKPVVRDAEARKLVYLQAMILEGLRMHPPPGGLLPRVAPPDGDLFNGEYLPGGVEIGVNTWGMLRDEDLFGPDPEMFRPERWLEIEEWRYAEMARVVGLAFGSGRFKCLGRGVALMELNKIIIEVRPFHLFELEILESLFDCCSLCGTLIGLWWIRRSRGKRLMLGLFCKGSSSYESQRDLQGMSYLETS